MPDVVTDPAPPAENPFAINSRDYWEHRFATDWDAKHGPEQAAFFARVALRGLPSWLGETITRETLSVCDWGCAQGDGTATLAEGLPGARVWGVDISTAAIATARQRYPQLHFEAGELREGTASRPIDVLFSSNTLEHFEEPFPILHRAAAAVRRFVVLLVPFAESPRISEHFVTFDEGNLPLALDGGHRLVFRAVYDTSHLAPTFWMGKQALLVYARDDRDLRRLTLADLGPMERTQLVVTDARTGRERLTAEDLYRAHAAALSVQEELRAARFQLANTQKQLADVVADRDALNQHALALDRRIRELEEDLARPPFGKLQRLSNSSRRRLREEGPVWLWRAIRRRVVRPEAAPPSDRPWESVQRLKEIEVVAEARRYRLPVARAPFAVVSTVKNEARRLPAFLDSLASQTVQPEELVIVDGGSTDETPSLLSEFAERRPWVRIVRRDGLNIAEGRNAGVALTRAPVIVFVDAGCVLEPDLLANLYGPMQDPAVDLAGGIYLPSRLSEHSRHFVRDWSTFTDWKTYLPSARCVAVRAEIFRKIGGFPEFLSLTGEDTLFDVTYRRASKRWVFNTEARVTWDAPETLEQAQRLVTAYARGDGESGFSDGAFRPGDRPAPGTVRAWLQAGYEDGRARRSSIEVRRRKIPGVVVLLSGVSMTDIGGGQRATQLALELIRRGSKVFFVNQYPRYGAQIDKVFFDVDLSLLELAFHADFSPDDFARRYAHLDVPVTVITEFPHASLFAQVRRLQELVPRARFVFDYVDMWDSQLGGDWYDRAVEDEMIAAADVVMASAKTLVEALQQRTRKPVHLVANAVNTHLFDGAVTHARPAELTRPYALYVGSLYGEWFDWAAVELAARQLPALDFVFVGDHHNVARAAALGALPNVRFLGPRAQVALPPYLQHAAVCLIPFRTDSGITRFVNPLKVYEYLAMRRPVVATAMEELSGLPGVFLATGAADFPRQIEAAMAATLDDAAIGAFVEGNSWAARIASLEAALGR